MEKSLNLDETLDLATKIATLVKAGDVVLLKGDLGAGKSTLIRKCIQTLLSQPEAIPSPTFTLVQTYETPNFLVWHFDLYRLKVPEEAYELDIEDAFHEGVSFIEWPERLGYLIPKEHLLIELSQGSSDDERLITFKPTTTWAKRIQSLA